QGKGNSEADYAFAFESSLLRKGRTNADGGKSFVLRQRQAESLLRQFHSTGAQLEVVRAREGDERLLGFGWTETELRFRHGEWSNRRDATKLIEFEKGIFGGNFRLTRLALHCEFRRFDDPC